MVILKIVVDDLQSEVLKKYLNRDFIQIIEPENFRVIDDDIPVIIYGCRLYKSLSEIHEYIDYNSHWVYRDDETKWAHCNLGNVIDELLDEFFECKQVSYDFIFNDITLNFIVNQIGKKPIIHMGQWSLYYMDTSSSPPILYTMKREGLEYAGVDSERFFSESVSVMGGECCVPFVREYCDLRGNNPKFIDLMYQAKTGEILTIESFIEKFSGIRNVSKKDLLVYMMRLMCS